MIKKKITLKSIAQECNVSAMSVSHVLNQNKQNHVSKATREKILKVIEKYNYSKNVSASRLKRQKNDCITLIIDAQQLYFRAYLDFHVHHEALTWDLICGVISYCEEHDFDVKLLPLFTREDSEIQELSKHLGHPYSDGAIFLGYKYLEQAYDVISKQKIPAVIMSTLVSQPRNEVSIDPVPGIRQAVRYLADNGHSKIAFCQLKTNYKFVDLRRKAFENEMKELSLWDSKLIYSAATEKDIRRLVADKKVIESFSAILCVNDPMADRWVREFDYAGISVPEDKAVIGFDNNPAYPDLSTVDVPRKTVGRQAAQMVIEAIKNKSQYSENISKESKFILRKSC